MTLLFAIYLLGIFRKSYNNRSSIIQKFDTILGKKLLLRQSFALRQSWNSHFNTITESDTIAEATNRESSVYIQKKGKNTYEI